MRCAIVWFAAILALGAAPAGGANLRGDAIFLCDADRQPSADLRPSTAQPRLSQSLAAKNFRAAYGTLADIAADALGTERSRPGVERFLGILRDPGRRVFSIAPDGTTEKLFRASAADTIAIDCTAPVPQYLVDVATAALLAERIRIEQVLPWEEGRAKRFEAARRDADDLLKNGLAMWPWELWLNGLRVPSSDAEPLFRTQWVLMRPTAGIEIDTRNRASADLHASVMIEPVGFVRYRGDGRSHWWGASLVVTSSTGRGAGIGGLFRWDNYVIGVTRHKGDETHPDSNFVLLGVDLYDALNKKRTELTDWQGFDRLRAAFGNP